ncbi:MAG: CoA transferase [Dehalococcoidia bacterium]|nr:CoA transferase [Dehalococcoidia bacterium]
MTMLALDGIKVLDLSRQSPGPFCTMLLGDFGADVLVVEAPPQFVSRGRGAPPPAADTEGARRRAHQSVARNKRSIVLNLREEAARAVFYRLCEDADVVVEGFRPGVVARLGVDYETVSKLNPRIVYCSLSGYGQTGPYHDLVGHDIDYISIGGALGSIGRPGQPPAIPHNLLADFAGGGLLSAFAITTALLARAHTGRGQYLDMAMTDGVLYLQASATAGVLLGGEPPSRGGGSLSGGSPHYDTYETADGKWLAFGAIEPYFWEHLCEAVGREDFKPLQHNASRHAEVREHFQRTFKQKTRDRWFAELRSIELCVAPVYTLDEALNDEHNRARQMVLEFDDPRAGKVRHVGIGPKLSDTPGTVRRLAPLAGEHTDEVLATLGYDAKSIAELRKRGVIG